jgi:hypothetical protein
MAACRFVEEEPARYAGHIRQPHNGYYAGDYFQASGWASELTGPYAERHDVPRAPAVTAGATTAIPAI